MVLHARSGLTRQSIFHTFTVVRNNCLCPIQIIILRSAEVIWLVAHQLDQYGFLVNPWIFKMANVAKELYCIEDWASDAAVLPLASSKTVSKMLRCKFNNVGNYVSIIVSLKFITLWSLSINARNLRWQGRCV